MNYYGYIYKTTNLINGKVYIGQHQGTISSHYIGSGKLINRAIKKYGKSNFRCEVLSFATNNLMLDGLEMKHIYEHRQILGKDFMYNLADGGNGVKGVPHTKEWKENASKIKSKNPTQYWIGKNRPEHEKIKISNSMKGRPSQYVMTNEIKNKISKTLSELAKNNSNHFKEIRSKSSGFNGKSHSEYTKNKIRISKLGQKHSEETKNKMKTSHKNYLKRKELLCQV